MSTYKLNPLRKRRSDDESSDSDEEFPPPVKKQRNCNGESNIKKVIVSKYQSALSWITDLPVNQFFKMSLLKNSVDAIDSEDGNEEREVIVVPDINDEEIAILAESTGTQHNNQEPTSFMQGSFSCRPKPLSSSTPFYRNGDLVGLPTVPSKKKMNGFHIKDQKPISRSPIQRKPKKHQRTPISNPGLDIEILLDSNESVDELEVESKPALRNLPLSAFSRTAANPIPLPSSNLRTGLNRLSGYSWTSSSISGSQPNTAHQVIRLKEKEDYKRLLDKMVAGSSYRPVKTDKTTAIQVDLTRDEHEEKVMQCSYNREILRKPVDDFIEKYYKACQYKKRTIVCPPIVLEDETRENIPPSTSILPEHQTTEKRIDFFSAEWLKELKISIDAETEKRMAWVKNEEHIVQRMKNRREEKLQAEKKKFEKYKVPGDVFPEPGGGRNDYPELTPEMDNMVNAALQKYVGNENDELSTFNGVTVTRKHMLTLLESSWLIDEVLNFYFNLIVERSKLDNYPSVYSFNTFFFTSMTTRGIPAVLRWTRKVDIFSYDIVFVPLHLGVHWALCYIDNRSKIIKYCDSMGTNHDSCLYYMQKYLIAEMKAKKNIVMDPDEYTLEVGKDLPQQMNGSDCGMFTLKYSEYISRDAPITFKQAHMNYFRRRMVYEILTKQLM